MSNVQRQLQSHRSELKEEFVTLYRHNWGSTIGLEVSKLSEMSDAELEQAVESQKGFQVEFR